MNSFKRILTVAVLLLIMSSAQAEIAIIVNPAAGVDTLAEADIKRIFLGKVKNFPNGKNVTVVDQTEGDFRVMFYEKVIGKNPVQLKSYWSTLIFSGKGTPPKEIGNSTAVKNFVASNPDAIGYIEASLADSTVKSVARF